jgi:transketolase
MARLGRTALYEGRTSRRLSKRHQEKETSMLNNLISQERTPMHRDDSTMPFGPRRGGFINAADRVFEEGWPLDEATVERCEAFDLVYRTLCAVMYNYAPLSGHPGGSISSGRFVARLLFDAMDYDFAEPNRQDADIISYAAGHKALGLYAMWALRNEVARIAAPDLLPRDEKSQLRLEDLLGFRRNPTTTTPLFKKFHAKPLDGHPTPATPFVRLSTGASGVGIPASFGLAWAAADLYGEDASRVHIIEGEGGMTPGRVAEAFAAAATASLDNIILHIDWNQASIDSNHVCRDGEVPGEYVQWTPAELAYLHDWNVILVPDGFDWQQITTAQRLALDFQNGQPTAIVYRTVKGWQYGIEGRASHGAGHGLCSSAFFAAVAPLLPKDVVPLSCCEADKQRCCGGADATIVEECYWNTLSIIRQVLEGSQAMVEAFASQLRAAKLRLDARQRKLRARAPRLDIAFETAAQVNGTIPPDLALNPGTKTTLRDELGRVLNYYNRKTGGAFVIAAADLLGSTSINKAAEGFPTGYYNRHVNPSARQLAIGGICEDAIMSMLSGISNFGAHIGAGSSYGAFSAPLGHIAARLHAIGNQARVAIEGGEYRPFFLVCAHAGLKTGEDGPTHADPQSLQLLQENFPLGTMITLTPWDPQEIWHLVSASLAKRPAIIAPFVTRPAELIIDRAALGLPPASAAAQGIYRLRTARWLSQGTIVLQGTGVTNAFLTQTLPLIDREKLDVDVYVITSSELFDMLPAAKRKRIFPEAHQQEAMGITDFTLATMTRWVRSDYGRKHTLHPFRHRHFLGSGPGAMVMKEAGLDGASQFETIRAYVRNR